MATSRGDQSRRLAGEMTVSIWVSFRDVSRVSGVASPPRAGRPETHRQNGRRGDRQAVFRRLPGPSGAYRPVSQAATTSTTAACRARYRHAPDRPAPTEAGHRSPPPPARELAARGMGRGLRLAGDHLQESGAVAFELGRAHAGDAGDLVEALGPVSAISIRVLSVKMT
jgi:hypothetical protein